MIGMGRGRRKNRTYYNLRLRRLAKKAPDRSKVIERTQNRSTGRITFGNERTRRAAVTNMDRLKVHGRAIRVEYNNDREYCKDCIQGHEHVSKYLGEDVTNNQAEYHGLIAGLKAAQLEGATHLDIRGDSELVIKQMTGENRVQAPRLKPLYTEARNLAASFSGVQYYWIPREENTEADRLANEAIDSTIKVLLLPQ